MAATAKTVAPIRILPARSILVQGRVRREGEVVTVPKGDAEAFIADGYAELAFGKGSARAPRAKRSRKSTAPTFDANGAEIEHGARGRRPLTPRSIDDGTEERGR